MGILPGHPTLPTCSLCSLLCVSVFSSLWALKLHQNQNHLVLTPHVTLKRVALVAGENPYFGQHTTTEEQNPKQNVLTPHVTERVALVAGENPYIGQHTTTEEQNPKQNVLTPHV